MTVNSPAIKGKPIPAHYRDMMRKIKSFTLEHSPNPSHPQYVWSYMVLPKDILKAYRKKGSL